MTYEQKVLHYQMLLQENCLFDVAGFDEEINNTRIVEMIDIKQIDFQRITEVQGISILTKVFVW